MAYAAGLGMSRGRGTYFMVFGAEDRFVVGFSVTTATTRMRGSASAGAAKLMFYCGKGPGRRERPGTSSRAREACRRSGGVLSRPGLHGAVVEGKGPAAPAADPPGEPRWISGWARGDWRVSAAASRLQRLRP